MKLSDSNSLLELNSNLKIKNIEVKSLREVEDLKTQVSNLISTQRNLEIQNENLFEQIKLKSSEHNNLLSEFKFEINQCKAESDTLKKQIRSPTTQIRDQNNYFDNENNERIKKILNTNSLSNIKNDSHIGYYRSNWSRNGAKLYLGPRSGVYYINGSNQKSYVNKNEHGSIIFKNSF